MSKFLLPVISNPPGDPAERGDAARNRQKLLEIAAQIIAEGGVEALTMDRLAEQAGTGKGTIFRRFGSRSGLLETLLNHTEKAFQREWMFGPPPLGPGAEPRERLLAYGRAVIDRVAITGELQEAAREDAEHRFGVPAVQLHRMHLAMLLRAAGAESTGVDIQLLCYALLASLEPGLLRFQRRNNGIDAERQYEFWQYLVDRILNREAELS
ncbi:TetR/AcrR family transcriptional regulator [Psychromicrobium sp. YIM B11713]|uniref:TetR/AcrR family transcriptional regulator n=1 Tax=Psychromicrobium sp. YIM B11713 TaxID=3145233 RepID=UPI00374E9D66